MRKALAVGLAVLSASGNLVPAVAQEAQPLSGLVPNQAGGLTDCTLLSDLSGPPPVSCENVEVPAACATPAARQQAKHFKLFPPLQTSGETLVYDQASSSSTKAAYVPHLKLGFEEDGGIIKNNQHRANADLMLGWLEGGRSLRAIIYSRHWKYHTSRHLIISHIKAARACGMEVNLNLVDDLPGRVTPARFARFASSVTHDVKNLVQSEAIWNEPNLPSWSAHFQGKDKAEAFAKLWHAGKKAIHHEAPSMPINGIDLSALRYPGIFAWHVARDYKRLYGEPMQITAWTYHPYQSHWPKNRPLQLGQHPIPRAKEIGITGTATVVGIVRGLFVAGLIATPDGRMPLISLNELALPVRNTGALAANNIPNKIQTEDVVEIENEVCGNPYIKGLSWYELDNTAPPVRPGLRPDPWNTGDANAAGLLGSTYFAKKAWADANANTCLADTPTPYNSTPLGLRR